MSGFSEFGVLAVARFWTWIEGSCLNALGLDLYQFGDPGAQL